MPEKHVFEYAIIRLIPRVDRGECLNAGIVLYCKTLKYLGFLYELNTGKLNALAPETDIREIDSHMQSFRRICLGGREAGIIGSQEMAARFRWLTARRSTVIQPSEVHAGYTADPEATLKRIFEQMVK